MRQVKRAEIKGGEMFFMNNRPESQCLAISDQCEGARVMGEAIGREDVLFHVHMSSGSLSWNNSESMVFVN